MSKIKTKVIYHEADLDGVTSAAVMMIDRSNRDEEVELIPYDYHKEFNQKLTNGHEVYMIDVSLKVPKIFEVAKDAAEFYLIDHHISFYEDLKLYCEENGIERKEVSFGSCLKIDVPEYNFIYYYTDKISACELTANLYPSNLGTKGKELISILGQYDTWRKDEKKLSNDKDWESIVMPVQYSLRSYSDPNKIAKIIWNLDNGGSKYNIEELVRQGKAILMYLDSTYKRNLDEFSFIFEYYNLKILAMNTTNFTSATFDHYWDEKLYDAMLAFNFTGKDWRISLYTTKTDTVDILRIAKFFGGGGHKGACGFRIPHNQLLFRKNKIDFGVLTLLDISQLPASYKGTDINDIIKVLKDLPMRDILFDGPIVDSRNLKIEEKPIQEILFVDDPEDGFKGKDLDYLIEPVDEILDETVDEFNIDPEPIDFDEKKEEKPKEKPKPKRVVIKRNKK